MSNGTLQPEELYGLLPAVYRERDAEQGYPLRALLGLVSEQSAIVRDDIEGLWNDYFIETSARWVIPYIGDLVGNNLLHGDSGSAEADTATQLFTDLVGPDLLPPPAVRTRADVAKTIYYRRRKGTLPMLEELARDVTGWAAHAVEFFELLCWNQNPNHVRLHSRAFADIRRVEPIDRVDGPFDAAAHTVDVRAIAQDEGWWNIRNIGFFLWRLGAYGMSCVPARAAASAPGWRFHFNPLGIPAPLFSRWRREGDEAGLATEYHVPNPIRHAFFYEDLRAHRELTPPRPHYTGLYGVFADCHDHALDACPDCSIFIYRNEEAIAPTNSVTTLPQIVCRRLDPWPPAPPTGRVIGIDVQAGRIAIGDGWPDATESLDVCYHHGFLADLGGGPYDRSKWLAVDDGVVHYYVKEAGAQPGDDPAATHTSVTDAVTDWIANDRADTIITILDNRNYALPATLDLSNENWLVIESTSGARPLLQTQLGGLEVDVLAPAAAGDPDRRSSLTLSGVVVEGFVHVTGDLGKLRVLHTTLAPGRRFTEDGEPVGSAPSLLVEADDAGDTINAQLRVEVAFSITGPMRIPDHAEGLWLLDSIVDGLTGISGRDVLDWFVAQDDPIPPAALPTLDGLAVSSSDPADPVGPPAHVERTTIFGPSVFKRIDLASNTIFTDIVISDQTHEGCVRFSFVPHLSQTPRRYVCQPDFEIQKQIKAAKDLALESGEVFTAAAAAAIRQQVRAWLVPTFTSVHYGDPGYGQLRMGCPCQILTGADNEAEMGVGCHLMQPQRETNLRVRLEEYLPFGLEAGLISVT